MRNPGCLYSAIHMLTSAIEGQALALGRDWTFDRVPDEHPVYHCFFDFQGLPGCLFDRQFTQSGYLRGAVIDNRLVAVLSKGVVGFLVRGDDYDKLGIGFGMIPRGEVSLVFAAFAAANGVFCGETYSALVMVVLLTTLIGPILLKPRLAYF